MANVEFRNVTKVFVDEKRGKFTAVNNCSFKVKDKEFLVFVGPSGCGKTTSLRMIAGLEKQTEGDILIDGHIVNKMHPKDRDIAMVFQAYALYPHMTVEENLSFGLKNMKVPKDEIDKKVRFAAKMLELEDLLDRKPKEISGGQRQRVAVGRAIVRNPKVFLFDEPLSNLDAKLRVQMRMELAKLHKKLQSTMIYVTHDQVEAMTLGDRIVVMNEGEIQQIDTPENIYKYPANTFVAGFVGLPPMNLLDARLENEKTLLVGDIKLEIPEEYREKYKDYIGKEVIFGIRPEHIYLISDDDNSKNSNYIEKYVDFVEFLGSESLLFFKIGNQQVVAKKTGDEVIPSDVVRKFRFNMKKMHLFDKETEKRI